LKYNFEEPKYNLMCVSKHFKNFREKNLGEP